MDTRSSEAARAAEHIARESYGRLVAFLAARTRDVAGAEEALAEAFATALRTWPLEGVQYHPESFLTEQGEKLLANFLKK